MTKRFGEFTAVDGLSLAVHPGRIFGLLGPNGAGKTTTIRMIVGITRPDEGSVELFGRPLTPEVTREATERIMTAITTLLEELRAESAPATRFDFRSAAETPPPGTAS